MFDEPPMYGRDDAGQMGDRLLKHRLFTNDAEELFRTFPPAHRPEPFADTAGHDDRPVHARFTAFTIGATKRVMFLPRCFAM